MKFKNMKKLLYLSLSILLMSFISSCSSDDTVIGNHPETNDSWIHIPIPITEPSNSFGRFNTLGYGYDVTGEYANENSARLQIIDIEKFKTENSARLSDRNILSQENTDNYSKDAVAFSKMISENVSATQQYNVFGETILFPSAMLSNKKYDPAYIYASYSHVIKQKRFRFNATPELLMEYLTPQFSKDIEEKTPEQIIKKYGTHIATDVYTGGIVELLFQAKTSNPDRERAARILLRKFTGGLVNETDIADVSKNYEKKLFYRMRGGDINLASAGIYNLDNIAPIIYFSKWQSSVTKEKAVLVDFGKDGLIILSDLVKDPVKKIQLKQYILKYINDNQVIIAS